MNILITESQLKFITKSESLNEALSLDTARVFQSYVRSDKSEIKINELFNKLRQSEDYIGQSKRGERLYFKYDSTLNYEEINPSETYRIIETIFSMNNIVLDIKSYVNGVGTLPDGRSVKIPKLLDISFKKMENGDLGRKLSDEYKKNLLNNYLNDKIRVKPNQSSIVISKAKYDIAGMSTGRGWTSCMNLDDGSNSGYVTCDVQEGSIIAYFINKNDLNIKNPIARLLIKPFINRFDENDIIFKPEDRTYGTAPIGFKTSVTALLDNNQEMDSVYDLNPELYADSISKTVVGKQISHNNKLKKIDYIIKNMEELDDDLFNLAPDKTKNRYLQYAIYDQYLTDDQFFYATDEQKMSYIEQTHEYDGSYNFLTDEQREWFDQNRHLFSQREIIKRMF